MTYGGYVPIRDCTFKVRTHKAAQELAQQMSEQLGRVIFYSDPDKPQDGWFIVSTRQFEEK